MILVVRLGQLTNIFNLLFLQIKEEALKKKFKSYEELKQEFKTMKMDIKTDGEIIAKLFMLYKNGSISVDDRKNILSHCEYYLHQVS
jgi:hypothetical protein